MLSLNDIAAVGRSRFYEKEGKYTDWAFTAFAVYIVLVVVAIALTMVAAAPQSYVYATVPSQYIVSGEDLIIKQIPFKGFTVNGYLLEQPPVDLSFVWVYFALIIPPFICVVVIQAITNHRRGKYVDEFLEKYRLGDIDTDDAPRVASRFDAER